MAVPAQYFFDGDGTTRIFPIASKIISQEYMKMFLDNVEVFDTESFDIINNSVVFITPPALNVEIEIWVAESIEALANLGKPNAVGTVSENVTDVITVAEVVNDGSLAEAVEIINTAVVQTEVTKTVGVGKEFETLHQALVWAESQLFLAGGLVHLNLDAGTHEVGSHEGADYTYNFPHGRLDIIGASYYPTDTTITINASRGETTLFEVFGSASVVFQSVSLDGSVGGHISSTNITALRVSGGGTLGVVFSEVNSWFGLEIEGGRAYSMFTTFNDLETAIIMTNGADLKLQQSGFDSCVTGIQATKGAHALLESTTFTNVTTETNIELNKISPDGSYILDGTQSPSSSPGVIGETIITIGTGGDYATFEEARAWYYETYASTTGSVIFDFLDLYPATISAQCDDATGCFLEVRNGNKVRLQANGGTVFLTVLTSPNGKNNDGFIVDGGSILEISNMYIDGGAQLSSTTGILADNGGIVNIHNSSISGWGDNLYVDNKSHAIIDGSTISGAYGATRDLTSIIQVHRNSSLVFRDSSTVSQPDGGGTFAIPGIYVTSASTVYSDTLTLSFRNLTTCVIANDQGKFMSINTSHNFTNCETGFAVPEVDVGIKAVIELHKANYVGTPTGGLYNIDLNIIQPSGSYISDGTVNIYAGGGGEVISDRTIKVIDVAGGADFTDLTEAFAWLNTVTFLKDGLVIFELEAGTYQMPVAHDNLYSLYSIDSPPLSAFRDKRVHFIGTGLTNADVIITPDQEFPYYSYVHGDVFNTMFEIRGGELYFDNLTLDTLVYSYSSYYAEELDLFHIHDGSKVKVNNCVISAFHGTWVRDNSTIDIIDTPISVTYYFLDLQVDDNSVARFQNVALTGSLLRYTATNRSAIIFEDDCTSNGVALALDANSEANPKFNTISTDMAYVTDSLAPLVSTLASVTTANRPTSGNNGLSVFDSTLGKPIWYTGTVWVDATGLTV